MVLPLGSFFNPLAKQCDLLRRKGRRVVGHAYFRICRSYSCDQFRRIGFARYNRPTSGFSHAQCVLSENERHTVLLPDPPVTGNAILIEDRPDITAEAHVITAPLIMKRPNSSPCRPSATDQGYRSSCHDQTSAKEYGSAEHHNISSTKAGLREKDMHLRNDKSGLGGLCRKPRARAGTGVRLRHALPCPDAYDRPPGPWLTTAQAVPAPHALSILMGSMDRSLRNSNTSDLIFGFRG